MPDSASFIQIDGDMLDARMDDVTGLKRFVTVDERLNALGVSAFGELNTAPLTPMAAWTFAYNINTDMVTASTANGGAVTQATGQAALSTGTAADGSAVLRTNRVLRYTPGAGAVARFTARFTPGVAGSQQAIGIGDANDGFFFGYDGAAFGILRRANGVDYWTPKTAWNIAQPDFDVTLGNIYQVRFQWLGFGAITFSMEDPITGRLMPVHIIRYANSSTATSVLNPTLPLRAEVANTGNETAVVLHTPSGGAFTEVALPDTTNPLDILRTDSVQYTTTGSANVNVVTYRNKATYATQVNRIPMTPRYWQGGNLTDNGSIVFTVYRNATFVSGTLTYADVNVTNSPIEKATDALEISGGSVVGVIASGTTEALLLDVRAMGIVILPSETLTIAAQRTGTNRTIISTLTWSEGF